MSDRKQVIDLPLDKGESVELFMDGESGTWRLFIQPGHYCVDLSLARLREFHESLNRTIRDIEADPEGFNAEVRSRWER